MFVAVQRTNAAMVAFEWRTDTRDRNGNFLEGYCDNPGETGGSGDLVDLNGGSGVVRSSEILEKFKGRAERICWQ